MYLGIFFDFFLFVTRYEIKSVQDVIDYVVDQMAEKQLKPIEGDKAWES